jgi:hypothetical protein
MRKTSLKSIHDNAPFCPMILAALAIATTAVISSRSVSAADNPTGILIRPANYDPEDEWEYTRRRGELSPGMVADGKIWNRANEDLRAAVSGASPAPANAEGAAAPVSAASGTPAPRMTYAEAYAQIPFVRSEYEATMRRWS